MHGIWKEMIRSYFTATTGIVISLYLVCLLFYPDGAFSPPDIGRILLTAFFCTLPCVAIFLLKKPGGKRIIIFEVGYLTTVIVIELCCAFLWGWISADRYLEALVFIVPIAAIHILGILIKRHRDKNLTDQINDRLKARYHT